MTSIKLKFRTHTNDNKKGVLYFQIIHNRIVKQVKTDYCIYVSEWQNGGIASSSPESESRNHALKVIRDKIAWEQSKLEQVVKSFESVGKPYTAEDIIRRYKKSASDITTVFEYMRYQSERLKKLGKLRTSETYRQTLNSFMRFRSGVDLYFDMLDADMVEHYESYMRANSLSRNTTSFYMRILRCIYNRAVEDGLTVQTGPFKRVYTGVDKTAKRAITLKEIKRIKELILTDAPDLDYARDIFLFSFYMRGMSFIDIAYLRKKDLSHGYVTYIRKKTGQQLAIRWERAMQEIVDKYPENPTQYLLPIIIRQDGTERQQYLNKILFVNRKLKQIAQLARIAMPLSMYVSRHSWASIAKARNVPLSVISEGMGHDNEETTRIYLATIQTNQIDEANNRILREL
ncbi:tyrosine-type recombinase/integrase [Odoribacter lunatus]|uniref:tyrosine-type recombinase/integrase n=1 Tax=Odoribacter lunatus TaxID=2941335 RepID=UPI002040BDBC|nr:site-specific integrase [Odoribacter lunatus]